MKKRGKALIFNHLFYKRAFAQRRIVNEIKALEMAKGVAAAQLNPLTTGETTLFNLVTITP